MRSGIRTILALLCTTPAVSLAVPITFEFSGNLTFTSDPLGLDPGVALGDAFGGSFTFDDAVAPSFSDTTFATYLDLISAFDVNVGGVGFTRAALPLGPSTPSTSGVQIENDRLADGRDGFSYMSSLLPLPTDPAGPLFFRTVQLMGVSSNQATFADTSLPPALDLTSFDYVPVLFSVTYQLWNSPSEFVSNGQMSGQVTSLRQVSTAVPEPGVIPLFLAAGIALLYFSRRRVASSITR